MANRQACASVRTQQSEHVPTDVFDLVIVDEEPDQIQRSISRGGYADLAFGLLSKLALLVDPGASARRKWELWEWLHDDRPDSRVGGITFRQCCLAEGCDPEEVVLAIHEHLEAIGVWIQRPTPLRRSYRRLRKLQRAGIGMELNPEEIATYVGPKPRNRKKRNDAQTEIFA